MIPNTTAIAQTDPLQFATIAIKDAVTQATEDAARVHERIRDIGLDVAHLTSRCVRTPVYLMSYGIVYATLFVARSIPHGNPAVQGMIDGGRAAIHAVNRSTLLEPKG